MSETPREMIQTLEEISLNAWPSLQQILYDGWILRFADGHTKRANSVNPVYLSNQDVHEKIKRCEQTYVEKNLKPIFRITPLAHPKNLDGLLANAGYEKKDVSSVQVLNLGSFQPQATDDIRLEAEFSQDWLDSLIQLGSVTIDSQEALAGILRNIASKKCFAVLMKENQVVSCGLGILENHYVGLFEIATAQTERRKGFGKELILNILAWSKHQGAQIAYLQVVTANLRFMRYSSSNVKTNF